MTIIIVNEDNFKEEVEESETPVIVDFYADWCAPCKMMKPIFDETSNDYEGKLKFTKLNTEENQALALKFGIDAIPCLIVIKDGKEISRIKGLMPKEALKQKIDQILGSD